MATSTANSNEDDYSPDAAPGREKWHVKKIDNELDGITSRVSTVGRYPVVISRLILIRVSINETAFLRRFSADECSKRYNSRKPFCIPPIVDHNRGKSSGVTIFRGHVLSTSLDCERYFV